MRRTPPIPSTTARRRPRTIPAAILGAIAIVGVSFTASARTPAPVAVASAVTASADQAPAAQSQRRYKATRRFVVDRETGQLRMPTAEEVTQLVDSLTTLTKRNAEGLQQTVAPNGTIAVDLDGGFAGVMLVRTNEDGTTETKCVFTFEEGAEFLGLVEDVVVK
jgi:hypothetical protein